MGWNRSPLVTPSQKYGLCRAEEVVFYRRWLAVTARRDADVAAHGLHPCGLPSCDQHEVSVKQFKYCGDCEAEWYCAEHQVLHWKEHKPICRARTAAAADAIATGTAAVD